MKKIVLASVSALALLTVAACSDSADTTQTQSVPDTQHDRAGPGSSRAGDPAGHEPAPTQPAQ